METNKTHGTTTTQADSRKRASRRISGLTLCALIVLSSSVTFAGDVSKAYCARFEAAFKKCSNKCADYIRRQPEYPDKMTKQDIIEALNGCTAICLEPTEFKPQDAVSCDKYR